MKRPRDEHLQDERILQLTALELAAATTGRAQEALPTAAERRHLRSCAACMTQAGEIRGALWALELAAGDLSAEQAGAAWDEARRRLESGPAVRSRGSSNRVRGGLREIVRDLVASLVPEPLHPSPALRGPGAAPSLLVFETDEYLVSLSLSRSPRTERLRLVGSVTPLSADHLPPGGTASIHAGIDLFRAAINDQGEFQVEGIPPGAVLHADIVFGDARIQVSPIQVGDLDDASPAE